MNEIILSNKNGVVTANSIDISNKFGKEHSKVKRTIKNFENDVANFGEMFYLSKSFDSYGREQECYEMNRDGFSLVVMGFTGKKALQWKLKYIDAFNKMEEALKSSPIITALPTTYKEALIQLLEQVEKNEKLEEERLVILPKAEYHDEVLKKDGLITTTVVAKDLGFSSATKLNKILNMNRIIYKSRDGVWCPYSEYEWLISDGYADYESYKEESAKPCLKWTEKGRKWIINNYQKWINAA